MKERKYYIAWQDPTASLAISRADKFYCPDVAIKTDGKNSNSTQHKIDELIHLLKTKRKTGGNHAEYRQRLKYARKLRKELFL